MNKDKQIHFQHIRDKSIEPWLISCKRSGYSGANREFCISRTGAYPYCNLHLVESGKMELVFRNHKFIIKAGQLFVLPAFEVHEYRSLEEETVIKWFEYVGGDSLTLTRKLIEKNDGPVISMSGDRSGMDLLNQCITKRYLPYEQSVIIYQLFMSMLKKVQPNPVWQDQKNPLQNVIKYINHHLFEDLSLKDLCDKGHFSSSYMNRLFKKYYQMTPMEYVYHLRITKAKKLLCESNLSLQEISVDCGFYDVSHLIHRFSQSEGMTPESYRKETLSYTE